MPTPRAQLEHAWALASAGRSDDAARELDLALAAGVPVDDADLASIAGVLCARLGRMAAAVDLLSRAAARSPDDAKLVNNLAVACVLAGRTDVSLPLLRAFVASHPQDARARFNLAIALHHAHDVEPAIESYATAVALSEADAGLRAEATYNRASLLLATGRLAEGLAAFESRFDRPGRRFGPTVPSRRWDGSPVETLVVYAEQGLGDLVFAARWIPEVCRRRLARRVVVVAPPTATRLLRSIGDSDLRSGSLQITTPGQPLPPHEAHVPAMSLMHTLRLAPDDVRGSPYARIPPDDAARWASRLADLSRPLIGLCWHGRPGIDDARHLPAAMLRAAMPEGPTFVSLCPDAPPPPGTVSFAPDLTDLAETAALLSRLDLVVTVDTLVAHLAGAVGVPTVLLAKALPDWRWGLSGECSPWYDTITVARQLAANDWTAPLARATDQVHGLLRSS